MLYVLFTIGQDWCAAPAADVVQIVPNVTGVPLLGCPGLISGMMRYRGEAIPLIDLRSYFTGQPCATAATTRILIVKQTSGKQRWSFIGLRAERVTSTIRLASGTFESTELSTQPFLQGIAVANDGNMVRRFDLSGFLAHVASHIDAKDEVA